ncbi:MAG: hypothetical protein K1X38_03490 [Microthrixaceae bacterium]|nr:hypothetical protein [Microthrixaceae bacterium]
MKMAAFRPADKIDILDLFEILSISAPEQVADIVDDVYGVDALPNPAREETILAARSLLDYADQTRRAALRHRSAVQRRNTDDL